MADPWKTEGSKRPTVADDKTAAERARQMYPVARDFEKRVGFVAGAAWQAEQAAARRVTPNRETLAAAIIDIEQPERNALTKPDDALTMVRTDPGFFICRNALAKADALLESGVLVPADQVRAETLEALANDEADWARKAWRSGEAETVSKMRKAILGRAAEYRKATSA